MEHTNKYDGIAPVVSENEHPESSKSVQFSQTDSDKEILPGPDNNDFAAAAAIGGDAEIPGTNHLKRDITMRQMFFMALGGSIGAGLFVSSGQALSIGGPASLIINFAICGLMVSMTMASLGEMATSYPVTGAFYDYTVRFVGKQWGFTMGWNFVFNWLIVLPFELTTIGAQIRYWSPSFESWWLVLPFAVLLIVIALCGAKWFAELEHWLGVCKALALTVFICFALALITKGTPGQPALGDKYWHNPGAFINGFQGFLAVFRVAGMSYGGTEMLGLTAAECRRPHRIMPVATKVVFFRLIMFYILSLLMLGFVVPANSPNLAAVGHGAKYSPFVLAANLAQFPGLATFFNLCIVIALISMANAAIFASSRALQALCDKGMGPARFAQITKRGIPFWAIVVAFGFSLLAFITAAPGGDEIFDWLLSLSAMSNYFTWASICFSHIRMRRAMKAQGHNLDEIIWRSPFGVWGSYLALVVCACGVCAQVVVAAWPVGGRYDARAVTRDVIGIPFLLLIFALYTMYERRREGGEKRFLVPLTEVDLTTGLRDTAYAAVADDEYMNEKRAVMAGTGYDETWPWYRKAPFYAGLKGRKISAWPGMLSAVLSKREQSAASSE